jgi:hypothetical protein
MVTTLTACLLCAFLQRVTRTRLRTLRPSTSGRRCIAQTALPMRAVMDSGESRPDRVTRSSGWRVHDGHSVGDADAPPLLAHRAVVRPAQGDQVVHRGLPYAPRDLPRLGRAQAIPNGCRGVELVSWTSRARARKLTEDAALVKVCSLGFHIGRWSAGRELRQPYACATPARSARGGHEVHLC